MTQDVFHGTIPALLTPCTPDRQPGFAALVRKGHRMVAARNGIALNPCSASV